MRYSSLLGHKISVYWPYYMAAMCVYKLIRKKIWMTFVKINGIFLLDTSINSVNVPYQSDVQ